MGGKTLEGESPLLKEGALSLQTSLTHRELPPRAPAFSWQRVVSLCMARVLLGEAFCRLGRYRVLAKCGCRAHFVSGARFVGIITLHECRDSACKSGAKPCHVKNLHLPPKQKTSPQDPATKRKRKDFSLRKWRGLVGKFGEDEGGLEGEGTPSERGSLLPPRSFLTPSALPHSTSSCRDGSRDSDRRCRERM